MLSIAQAALQNVRSYASKTAIAGRGRGLKHATAADSSIPENVLSGGTCTEQHALSPPLTEADATRALKATHDELDFVVRVNCFERSGSGCCRSVHSGWCR
ncbi:hypothetical protein GCM10022247_35320 [Allokutzneria multivorans]|uniref:Uncharacterized protein n=1 Tax=Allokutzneria multivorans TaxID=1142134 RepID=A0ABP7SCV4_9PSEU